VLHLTEYVYLALDFWRYLRGKDYFRQPQGLGPYFQDNRCYYNDLTGKALWNGAFKDGVPVLYLPSSGKSVTNPCMVLLWALGSLDRYFLYKEIRFLDNVRRASRWLLDNVHPDGYWPIDIECYSPSKGYHSSNSCMNQGLALSFVTRILQNELLDCNLHLEFDDLAKRVAENMLLPLDHGGTAREHGEDLYLYEFASVNECLVFNGWVFGIFGLWDHARRTADPVVQGKLDRSILTLNKTLSLFIRNNGWSYYDTAGRLASPFYQDLHISLLEALYRLTTIETFREQMQVCQKGNSFINRTWYTITKIKDKLFDKQLYSSQPLTK